jgi:hypothetical protein
MMMGGMHIYEIWHIACELPAGVEHVFRNESADTASCRPAGFWFLVGCCRWFLVGTLHTCLGFVLCFMKGKYTVTVVIARIHACGMKTSGR